MKEYACSHCHTPMSFIDFNRNPYCSAPACQQKRVAQELIENKMVASAQVKYAAETFLENNPDVAETMRKKERKQALTVALVPSNNTSLTKLSQARAAKFEAHLRGVYLDLEAQTPENRPTYVAEVADDDQPEIKNLLGKACATCKGNCCRLGENHAFQDYWSLQRYLRNQAPMSEDELVSQYLTYLPDYSTDEACVFQGSKGCTLPENMRSITCNNHKCYPLIEFQKQISHEPDRIAAVGAVRGRNVDTITVFTDKEFSYIPSN